MKIVWERDSVDRSRRLRGVARTAQSRVHHRHDHDEDPGTEEVPEEDPGRPRLRLSPRPAQRAGHRRHGPRFRQPCLQRLGRTAAGAPGRGARPLTAKNWKRSRACGGSHEPATDLGQSGGLQHANRPAGRSGRVHSHGAATALAAQPGWPTGTFCWPPACCCLPFARGSRQSITLSVFVPTHHRRACALRVPAPAPVAASHRDCPPRAGCRAC